jgi:hypothetical protein
LAEREGFEPSEPFTVHTLSKRAPSATRPSLQNVNHILNLDISKSRRRIFLCGNIVGTLWELFAWISDNQFRSNATLMTLVGSSVSRGMDDFGTIPTFFASSANRLSVRCI